MTKTTTPRWTDRFSKPLRDRLERSHVHFDVGVACRVTGPARARRLARVLENLKALPPARAKALTVYARERLAAEEASETARERIRTHRSILCGYMAGPIALADQGAVEARLP